MYGLEEKCEEVSPSSAAECGMSGSKSVHADVPARGSVLRFRSVCGDIYVGRYEFLDFSLGLALFTEVRLEGEEETDKGIRMFNWNMIEVLQVIKPRGKDGKMFQLPKYEKKHLEDREKENMQRRCMEAKKIGPGVSKVAQSIFDALSKTMECSWKEDKSIDVHGEVIVRPPYVAGSCSGRNNKAVEHVAKLLNATREQLGLN